MRFPAFKIVVFAAVVASAVVLFEFATRAAYQPPAPAAAEAAAKPADNDGPLGSQLDAILKKIRAKLAASAAGAPVAEKDYADELKQLDQLYAEHKNDQNDGPPNILYFEALIYSQVLQNPEKALALVEQIIATYPNSGPAKDLKDMLPVFQAEARAAWAARTLVVGTAFPNFVATGLDGKPLSPASYKGQVVLIDFWATWCPECVVSMPGLMDTYNHFHDQGFAIIGVSLDDDKAKLLQYLADNKITWPQFYDGKHWENALAVKYGVNKAPTTYLLDRDGVILAKDLAGAALDQAVAAALAKK